MTHTTFPTAKGQIAPGAVRTLTPFLFGLLGSWLTRQGLDVNDDLLSAVLVAGWGYVSFLFLRFCEVYLGEKWRYILGMGLVSAAPAYVQTPAVVTDKTGTAIVDEGTADLATLGFVLLVLGILAWLLVSGTLGLLLVGVGVALVVLSAVRR